MKWNVLYNTAGKPISAGFCIFDAKEGESVKTFDAPNKKMIAELRAKKRKPSAKRKAFMDLDPATLTLEDMKVVVEFMQERNGRL